MTKEELRKEATMTVEWECTPTIDRPLFVHAYITGAEPREKRIAELEKENAELKEQLGDKVMQKRKDKADLVWKLKTANEQKKSQLAEAKELIGELISSLSVVGECGEEECELLNRAEQFLNSEVEE